jgi:hypothetical protein
MRFSYLYCYNIGSVNSNMPPLICAVDRRPLGCEERSDNAAKQMNKTLKIEHTLSSLSLNHGEEITLYLSNNNGMPIQVEIRVMPNGEPQIFLKPQHMNVVRSFEVWEPMEILY